MAESEREINGRMYVDVSAEETMNIELDVDVTLNGLSSVIVESQVVSFANIVNMTDNSAEATSESRYASSALSAKRLLNEIESIITRLETLEKTVGKGGGEGGVVEGMFALDRENNAIHALLPLYSDGYIAAGGVGSASEAATLESRIAALETMMTNLTNNNGLQ